MVVSGKMKNIGNVNFWGIINHLKNSKMLYSEKYQLPPNLISNEELINIYKIPKKFHASLDNNADALEALATYFKLNIWYVFEDYKLLSVNSMHIFFELKDMRLFNKINTECLVKYGAMLRLNKRTPNIIDGIEFEPVIINSTSDNSTFVMSSTHIKRRLLKCKMNNLNIKIK